MGRKRNWRNGDDPISEPGSELHLIWLLPISVIVTFLTMGAVLGGLYWIIWSLV